MKFCHANNKLIINHAVLLVQLGINSTVLVPNITHSLAVFRSLKKSI